MLPIGHSTPRETIWELHTVISEIWCQVEKKIILEHWDDFLHYQWSYAWPRASTAFSCYFPTPCSWKLPGRVFFKNKWWPLLKGPFLLIFRQPTQTARSLASAWAASVTDSIRQQQVYLNRAKLQAKIKNQATSYRHHYNRIRWGKLGAGREGQLRRMPGLHSGKSEQHATDWKRRPENHVADFISPLCYSLHLLPNCLIIGATHLS